MLTKTDFVHVVKGIIVKGISVILSHVVKGIIVKGISVIL
jgi:hypothetical protein